LGGFGESGGGAVGDDAGPVGDSGELAFDDEAFRAVLELVDEALAPLVCGGGVLGDLAEVVLFLWVGVEVEEELAVGLRVPDEFPVAVREAVGVASVLDVEVLAGNGGALAHGGEEAVAVDGVRDGDAGHLKDGGHDVGEVTDVVMDLALADAVAGGGGEDAGDAGGAFVGTAFAEEVVVAEGFAVVADVDNDEIGIAANAVDGVEQTAELGVDVVDAAVVGGTGAEEGFALEVDVGAADAVAGGVEGGWLCPVADDGVRHAGAQVALEVELRWLEGGMGGEEADGEEVGARGVAAFHEAEGAVDGPVGVVEVVGLVPGLGCPVVVHDACTFFALAIGSGRTVGDVPLVVFVEDAVLKAAGELHVVEAVAGASR